MVSVDGPDCPLLPSHAAGFCAISPATIWADMARRWSSVRFISLSRSYSIHSATPLHSKSMDTPIISNNRSRSVMPCPD